ncbi:MAG: site-specific DNA-methyltransferase [Bacillota bacterium]|nr:site-specific DNA-methyltransferase [Bacillota bacterium]
MASSYIDEVFCKSCERMDDLPDGSVALTVTSPPYWNAVDYDRHADDPGAEYRTRRYSLGFEAYHEYLEWFLRISREVFRATKPGGFYTLVVGTVLLDGAHYPVPFHITSRLGGLGWEFHQDIVWHKVTGGVKRAGVFIQKPYPGYYYPNVMTEYILVFRKPGPPIYSARPEADLQGARTPTLRLYTNEIANNVWHIPPIPPGHLSHPCPFPEEIPLRLITLYSYPGDLVLDPFCGSGQTLKVAAALGRHFVGYEINEKYVRYAKSRLAEPLSIRAQQLIAVFEKIPHDAPRLDKGRKTRYPRPRSAPRKK